MSSSRRLCCYCAIATTLVHPVFAAADEVYSGVLVARERIVLSAPADASVTSVSVRPGDTVKAEAILAQIDPIPIQQDLAEAKAALASIAATQTAREEALALARSKLNRRRQAQGAISQEEMDHMEHEVSRAEAELDSAKASYAEQQARIDKLQYRLDHATIRAPRNGTVAARLTDPGSNVRRGDPLVRLITSDELLIRFAVPPDYSRLLEIGQPVIARSTDGGHEFSGRISHIAPALDTPSQMIFVEAELVTNNPDLRPGLTVQVSMGTD